MSDDAKVYVGNLDYGADEEQLRQEFQSVGEIESVVVVRDRETGRSRGFGFVTYTESSVLDKAIEEFNEKDLLGRQMRVNKARDKSTAYRGGGSSGYRGRGGYDSGSGSGYDRGSGSGNDRGSGSYSRGGGGYHRGGGGGYHRGGGGYSHGGGDNQGGYGRDGYGRDGYGADGGGYSQRYQ